MTANPSQRGSALRVAVKGSVLAFAAAMAVIACGSQKPPPAGDSLYKPTGATGGGGFQDAGTAAKLPGCGMKDDGSYCDCVDTPLFVDAPNMYFVLDRSGSMQQDNKWGAVRVVVSQILRGLGPRANFGATMFPGSNGDQCSAPKQILAISPGDPKGATDGPTTSQLLSATLVAPGGGTPTAEALRSVFPILKAAKGKTFVILATDGGPNCNANVACSIEQCQPNIEASQGCPPTGPNCCTAGNYESCLDSAATVSAVTALKMAGIPVYVIGLPGTGNPVYAQLLDNLATAGGTALPTSPKYYRVDSTNSDILLAALKKIAAQITATCEFKLTMAPAQADKVNVYFDEVVVPADPVNGWKIEGDTVTLLGNSCKKVLNGDVLDVRIITGCPTVEPR